MDTDRIYHVFYADGKWHVKREDAAKPMFSVDAKEQAIHLGKRLVLLPSGGRLVIHKKDGTIQSDLTYSAGED